MKERKNYLKIGILLFGISLLLWNCKKEQAPINDESNISEYLQNNFDFKDFKKTIPYEFVIDWNNLQKHYSEDLNLSYYEFPINYLTSFNPNNLNKQKGEGSYFIKFKIIATEHNDNEHNYYAVKFYQDIDLSDNELINSEVSFNNTKNYSGTINLFDKGGELVFAKKLESGCLKDGKIYYYNEFALSNSLKQMSNDCYTITVAHYTDWYILDPETGFYFYDRTSFEGTTSETICEDSGGYPPLPEDFLEVGAGSGVYSVTTDSTIVEIEEEMEEFVDKPCSGNPVLNPEIAPASSSGKEGGTFGCTRKDNTTCGGVSGKKEHNGLDIKADINANLFAMYGGVVSSIRDTFSSGEYKSNSFGNYVVITTVIDGNTYNVKYNHLNSVSVTQGQHIIAGDIIGLSGNTGNAAVIGITPHVHIQVYNSDWTQKLNPEDYLTTKFDTNYNPISNNCEN